MVWVYIASPRMVASNENSAASNEFVSSVGGKSTTEPRQERQREKVGRGGRGQDSVREKTKLRMKQDVEWVDEPTRETSKEGAREKSGQHDSVEREQERATEAPRSARCCRCCRMRLGRGKRGTREGWKLPQTEVCRGRRGEVAINKYTEPAKSEGDGEGGRASERTANGRTNERTDERMNE